MPCLLFVGDHYFILGDRCLSIVVRSLFPKVTLNADECWVSSLHPTYGGDEICAWLSSFRYRSRLPILFAGATKKRAIAPVQASLKSNFRMCDRKECKHRIVGYLLRGVIAYHRANITPISA